MICFSSASTSSGVSCSSLVRIWKPDTRRSFVAYKTLFCLITSTILFTNFLFCESSKYKCKKKFWNHFIRLHYFLMNSNPKCQRFQKGKLNFIVQLRTIHEINSHLFCFRFINFSNRCLVGHCFDNLHNFRFIKHFFSHQLFSASFRMLH